MLPCVSLISLSISFLNLMGEFGYNCNTILYNRATPCGGHLPIKATIIMDPNVQKMDLCNAAIVEPLLKDTPEIRTPLYSGHFAVSQICSPI